MDIDRDAIIEAVAASVPVLAMIGILYYIGTAFSDPDVGLSEVGGQALIGAIVLFVFMMFGIGLYFSLIRADGDGGGSPNGS